MVEPLDAIVVHGAVVGARRLVEVAGVVVPYDNTLVVDEHLLRPGGARTRVGGVAKGASGPGQPGARRKKPSPHLGLLPLR
jgi:hypothetical protein